MKQLRRIRASDGIRRTLTEVEDTLNTNAVKRRLCQNLQALIHTRKGTPGGSASYLAYELGVASTTFNKIKYGQYESLSIELLLRAHWLVHMPLSLELDEDGKLLISSSAVDAEGNIAEVWL